MDAIKFNQQLDAKLARDGIVDEALLRKFLDAYSYDAATTASWVSGKIAILRNRLLVGDALSIHSVDHKGPVEFETIAAFDEWVQAYFPGIID